MKQLIRSAMCDLYPPAAGFPGVRDCDVDEYLRKLERETNLLVWTGLVASAVVYVATPIFTVFVPLPSFALPRALRDEHALRISGARVYLVRQAVALLKMFGGICWGQHPDVRRAMKLAPYDADPGSFRRA